MSEYTPDTETVREQYTREQPPHIGTVKEKSAEFDRWLAAHDREVAARALREAARFQTAVDVTFKDLADVRDWLLARADGIEEAT